MRVLVGALGIALAAGGLRFAFPAPRIVFLNASVDVRYPVRASVAFLVAALGAFLVSRMVPSGKLRVLLGLMGALLAFFGADRYLFRLVAGPIDLTQAGVFGRTTIPWGQVRRVEPGTSVLVLWGLGDAQIRVSTDSFSGDERAILDRTIARHVREARPVR